MELVFESVHSSIGSTGDVTGFKIPRSYKGIDRCLQHVLNGGFESIGVPLPAAVVRAYILKGNAVALHCWRLVWKEERCGEGAGKANGKALLPLKSWFLPVGNLFERLAWEAPRSRAKGQKAAAACLSLWVVVGRVRRGWVLGRGFYGCFEIETKAKKGSPPRQHFNHANAVDFMSMQALCLIVCAKDPGCL